jgi:hypothetical protein
MMCGWATWTPVAGWRLRSGRRKSVAALVREMLSVARWRGFITVFDDEVEAEWRQ